MHHFGEEKAHVSAAVSRVATSTLSTAKWNGNTAFDPAVDGHPFERMWPPVALLIAKALARQGCPLSEREDIAQEVAIRLLCRQSDTPIEVGRYALGIARNLYLDGRRHPQPFTAELEESFQIAGPDLATTVEQQLALEAIGSMWNALSSEEQQLFESERQPTKDRALANRQKVQRHRLRVRFKQLTLGLLV